MTDSAAIRLGIRRAAMLLLFGAILGAAGKYHVIKKISIPGDYGWDYLTADSEGRRLYVSHDKEVVVLDLDSGAIVGKVPGSDVHGIAVVRELGRGFISATDPGSVTIFDLKTLAVIGKVTVGEDPNAIFYDPKTKRIFTIDRGSKRVSAIDPKIGKVVGTVEGLGGRTEHAVSDAAGHIFLNMQDLGTLLRIDAQALKVTDTWKLAPCELPSSMDMDRAAHRVFIGCRSGVMAVVDADSGRIVTTQPTGKGVDATEYNSGTGLIYFSSGADGTLSVFHQDTPEKYTLVERVKTEIGARTMALDHKTGRAYLSVAEFGPRPASTPGKAQPRAPMIPGTFAVLVVGE
ncbi:MAG: YncE family protein [Acidobacteriota bacterium]